MSRYNPHRDPEPIYKAAEIWRDRCLVGDRSVFREDRSLWTRERIEELKSGIVILDESDKSFLEKLKLQLSDLSSEVHQLMSEVLWLLWLFRSNMRQSTKRGQIQDVWSWSGEELSDDQPLLSDEALIGIGSPGTAFSTLSWKENLFLVNAISDFKIRDKADQRKLISDPWDFSRWLNGIPDDGRRQLRHILPHLLFPDDFERITSGLPKRKILVALGEFPDKKKSEWNRDRIETDHRLLELRESLEKERGEKIDFYDEDLKEIWDTEVSFWLLGWDPMAHNGTIPSAWPCGPEKPRIGDRIFVARIGQPPDGVVAVGIVVRAPYDAPHGDPSKAETGGTTRLVGVDLKESRIGEQDVIVGRADLKKQESKQQWDPKAVIVAIGGRQAYILQRLWKEHSPKPLLLRVSSCQNLILYGPPGTGKTYRLIRDHLPHYTDGKEHRYEFVTFHQNYAYEDFIEGIRPDTSQEGTIIYTVQDGVLKRICERARKEPTERFALLIDEINRGNIAKIFGELITLVEPDKRIRLDASGKREADCTGSEVTLPYSRERFGVPINVDIIGTMNTSDRSIALLDAALRRRFRFEELMPEPNLLKSIPDGAGGEIDLVSLLKTLNLRLTYLLHRDQTIGHSYFFKIENFEDLKQVFAGEILPLLQEAFYNDWARIRLVLADQTVDKEFQLVRVQDQKVEDLFPNGAFNEIGDGVAFEMVREDEITPDAIRKIYETETSE